MCVCVYWGGRGADRSVINLYSTVPRPGDLAVYKKHCDVHRSRAVSYFISDLFTGRRPMVIKQFLKNIPESQKSKSTHTHTHAYHSLGRPDRLTFSNFWTTSAGVFLCPKIVYIIFFIRVSKELKDLE